MKFYTVIRMDQYDCDFSVESHKIGAFLDRNAALDCARAEYDRLFSEFDKKIQELQEFYPPGLSEAASLITEENPKFGYYSIQFGYEKDHEFHSIAMDEWIF